MRDLYELAGEWLGKAVAAILVVLTSEPDAKCFN